MVVTDPIADMLTRIRNANQMKYNEVSMPVSRVKAEIAKILKDEGFIADYKISDEKPQGTLTLTLKYSNNKKRLRLSKTKSNTIPWYHLVCNYIIAT